MKKIKLFTLVALAATAFASCGEAELDQGTLDIKVQERAAVLIEQANEEYAASCEARMTTELKAMTDSIVTARKTAAAAQ